MNKKRTIYMSPTLFKIAEKTLGGGFSKRLTEIADRYEMLLNSLPLPDFTETELEALGEVVLGAEIDARKIRGLHLDVLDAATGTDEERQELMKKIEPLTIGQRLAIIEMIENG